MLSHRTVTVVALALAVVALASGMGVTSAWADGDPASDMLLAQNVFFPYTPPVSPGLQNELNRATAEMQRAREPLKIAIIASKADLGAITPLFGEPRAYASFLGAEIGSSAGHPLLVVMADGYGTAGLSAAAKDAVAALPPPPSTQSDALATAALQAARKVAAANGHPLPGTAASEHAHDAVSTLDATRAVLIALLLGAALVTAGGLSLLSVRWGDRTAGQHVRAYFASDATRTTQSALGLLWLLDAGLQAHSASRAVVQSLRANAIGQPGWLAQSINWAAHIVGQNLEMWNTLFALAPLLIGIGLLYRPTVKLSLASSFAWALVAWCFGEAFGMLFTTRAQPLAGAPGAAILYTVIGVIAWPNGRQGGLLGVRGTKTAWATVWVIMAVLWLRAPSSSADAVTNIINAAPSGMSWLSSLQDTAANAASGNGLPIAITLAAVSASIGILVLIGQRPNALLALAVVVNVTYWLLGQGLGGILESRAPDPNAAPLFILLAYCLYTLNSNKPPAAHTPMPDAQAKLVVRSLEDRSGTSVTARESIVPRGCAAGPAPRWRPRRRCRGFNR
jgi:hypothetical protein